jgi:hypothetical protein
MSTGKLTSILPNGERIEQLITSAKGPSLATLQAAVGGYIERVKVRFNGRVRDGYVNEEGIAKGLPSNSVATDMLTDIYVGTVLFGTLAIWEPDPKKPKQLDGETVI